MGEKRKDYISWDEYFMGVALLSGMRSKDPNTQVGACIVSQDNKILSMGYNGFPKGCDDDEFPWARTGEGNETKYPFVTHAELNAILNYRGGSLEGAKLYVSLFPCNECAKAIIQSGILPRREDRGLRLGQVRGHGRDPGLQADVPRGGGRAGALPAYRPQDRAGGITKKKGGIGIMSFVTSEKMLLDAQKGGYAVGAFNVENMEMVMAVIAAAEELRAPLMMQTTPSTIKYAGLEMYLANVKAAAERASVPVCLHLDHGDSFDLAMRALRVGYTSIMIDGSHNVFEENIAVTKAVADACRPSNIPVEAELGKVGGKEDDLDGGNGGYTDPQEAAEFVERTGVTSAR